MRIHELLKKAPHADGSRLLAELTGASISEIFLHPEREVDRETEARYVSGVERLNRGEPMQYVLGYAYFYGRQFFVDPRVLIPRFDTEAVFEDVNELRFEGNAKGPKILDLCAGSGCIGISLKLEHPDWDLTLSDVSPDALEVARKNALHLGAEVRFVQSDLFSDVPEVFDVIVSNPPYVSDAVIETLEPCVRDHEPLLALSGGADGLDYYRRILPEAKARLVPGGRLFVEIGDEQEEDVKALFLENGYDEVRGEKDLSGRSRVVHGVLSKE